MDVSTLYLKYGSNSIRYTTWDISGGTIQFTFVLSDNFMYLSGVPSSGDGRIVMSYFKDAQGNYYAGGSEHRGGLLPIYSITYYNTSVENLAENYTIPKAINCTSPTGKILYSSKAIITHNDAATVVIPNVYSNSNVTRFSTVTIAGTNYFAIDTNNLVLLN